MAMRLLNHSKKLALMLLCMALVFVGVIFVQSRHLANSVPSHRLIYYDEKYFSEGVQSARQNDSVQAANIIGAVVPHHLLPGFIISDVFKRLQLQQPKRVILIGPNHKEAGTHKVITSQYGWETPFGVVTPDDTMIQDLVDRGTAHIDEPVMEDEHSVAGIMPYIKYYLPDATVVPLILRGTIDRKEVESLAKTIAGLRDEDTIILGSVDFSHYLTSAVAEKNDKRTLALMQRFDYDQLFGLNNDYMDSPPSIVVFLMAMQDLGKSDFSVLQHTNSGIIQHNGTMETTSYFSLLFQ